MEPKLPYIIYLIAVLILVAPAFLASNTNTKVLFKNMALWGIVVLVIILNNDIKKLITNQAG